MKHSKIEIIENTPRNLVKIFTSVFPMLDGKNYFTGELPPDLDRNGQIGMMADNQQDWEVLWQATGTAAPGALPRDTQAVMFMAANKAGHHVTTAVASAVKKHKEINLEWNVTYTPMADGEKRRVSFAVILLPKAVGVSSHYNYFDQQPVVTTQPQSPSL